MQGLDGYFMEEENGYTENDDSGADQKDHDSRDQIESLEFDLERTRIQAESARKYQFIADSSRDFMTLVDRSYTYEAVNTSYLSAMGLKASDVIGKSVSDLWGQEIFDKKIKPYLDDAFSGECLNYEAWFDFPELGRGYWKVIFSPYHDEMGTITHVSVVSHDLTDRRIAEEALKASEQKFESIVESIPDLVYRLDPQGHIVFINKAAKRYGYDPDELIGRHILDIVHPDDREKARRRVNERRTGDRSTRYLEVRLLSKAGTGISVEIGSDQPILAFKAEGLYGQCASESLVFTGTQGLARDVSARKRVESLASERTSLYQVMIENSATGMAVLSRDGLVIRLNKKFSEMVGWTEEEVAGTPFMDYVAPHDRELVKENRARRLRNEEVPAEYEMDVLHKSGHVINVLVQVGMLPESGTAIISALDISSRKKVELDMRLAKESAEQASRIKTEFLANMSHEVRTPLNGILGMAELVMLSDLNEEQRENVQMIRESGRNLLNILNDLLDISRIEAGRMDLENQPFNMADLLNEVERLYSDQAKSKGLLLEFEALDPIPWNLHGDGGRIRQILNNLVGNAIKFTHNGHVKISGCYVESPAGTAPRLLFLVKDTGMGMPKDNLGLMFEPFTQADGSFTRRYSGTGLGLGIVRRLVGLMGGIINVDSEPGCGTQIWFTVPLGKPEKVKKSSRTVVAYGIHPPALRVLVAEDNTVNRIYAEKLLVEMGHMAVAVSNGREALEALKGGGFDLVLMDVQMPEMDGVEATQQIRSGEVRKEVRDIPIIAMTAHAMKGDKEVFLASGMTDYVSKPVSMVDLAQAIDRAFSSIGSTL